MPLGFAKSLLSRYEAPAGGGGGAAYYYTDETSSASADQAGYVLTKGSSPFAASSEISVVYWYRCNSGSDKSKVWHGQSNADAIPGRWYASFVSDSRIELHTLQPNNRMSALFVGPITGSTRLDVFDGAWHCVMMYNNAAATTGSSIGTDYMAVWDDRVATTSAATTGTAQVTDYSVYNTAALDTMDNIETLCFGFRDYQNLNPTNMSVADQFSGTNFDFGPIWIYDKKIDFTSSTVRDYYYDSTATDGYVDGGTDGTAGGAEQPAIYMYHDGTDWKNGGTKFNSTATKVTKGSGDITATNTDGPGTGGTT